MGTILDTTVFITLERAIRTLPQRGAMAEAGDALKPPSVGPYFVMVAAAVISGR